MLINYYYSDELTNDTEGNLVTLCRSCAKENRDVIQWAQRGDDGNECELCRASNNPERSAYLDGLIYA